jgi:hypothetical protein
VPLLFERTDNGNQSVRSETKVSIRTRGGKPGEFKPKTVKLRARSEIRPVYWLAPQVTIDKDPAALPDRAATEAALIEEAGDWVSRQIQKGNIS